MGTTKHLILLIFLSLASICQGQWVVRTDGIPDGLPRKPSYFSGVLDSTSFSKWRGDRMDILHSAGFVAANLIPKKDSLGITWIWDFGEKYQFDRIKITPDSLHPNSLPDSLTNIPLSPGVFTKVVEDVFHSYEDMGYPFVSLEWKIKAWEGRDVNAEVIIHEGPYIQLDSVVVKGYDRFPRGLLKHGLGLKIPMPYRESYLLGLRERTGSIPYLQMTRPPQMAFSEKKNVVFLYLEKRNANRFDGVIGLNTSDDGTVTLNGSVDLFLTNIFGGGESFGFAWKRPDNGIQQLDIDLEVPYIFGTPIWLSGDFGLYNQDSSFANRSYGINLKYQIQAKGFIKGGFSGGSSNLLPFGEGLSGYGSTRTQKAIIGLSWSDTKGRIPRKGYSISLDYGTGSRVTNDGNFSLSEFVGRVAWYTPLWKQHHLLVKTDAKWLFSENLYQNELYRIGGLRTLRGFNEQSIFTSRYVQGTSEYRFFFEETSFIQVFSDLAWVSNPSELIDDNLFTGLGAGFTFTTKGGVFSLAYALGRTSETPFDLRTGKVHFGYINTF